MLRSHVTGPSIAPGAALAVAVHGPAGWQLFEAVDGVRSRARPSPVEPGTPWDLASVTKPFVAATAVRLARDGGPALETPLGSLLPEIADTPSAAVPLALLLSHRAGLEPHRPLFAPLVDGGRLERGAALRQAAEARRDECRGRPGPDGFAPVYSDLGYLLLGEALSRATSAPLDQLVEQQVSAPLQLDAATAEQWRRRDPSFQARVAPTETVEWRGGEIVGGVHDENAFAFAGAGLTGQAGLFATAASVARFGMAVLDALSGRETSWLGVEHAAWMIRERPGGSLRAGFDGCSGELPAAGRLAGPRAFGHLGFTGTSLWCDPDAGLAVALLTNRVCPSRDDVRIRQARPALHEAVYALFAGRP